MKKCKFYCDYCGDKIPDKHVKNGFKIKTGWTVLPLSWWDMAKGLMLGEYVIDGIGGDGCKNCYKSYVNWAKSRKKK